MIYELDKVSRPFPQGETTIKALEEVSLSVAEGEFVAITGPSGSGKSTLLHILGLLDREYRGTLTFAGHPLKGLSAGQRAALRLANIGFVFQSFHLLPPMSVRDNVALPHWRLHGGRRAARRKASELLKQVGLGHRLTHSVRRLSGGEMQRVAVARALVNDPQLVLADEPTGNLDASSTRTIVELIQEVHQAGRTVVCVSYETELLESADRIVQLRYGRLED